jgi:hypothetical protein
MSLEWWNDAHVIESPLLPSAIRGGGSLGPSHLVNQVQGSGLSYIRLRPSTAIGRGTKQ